MLLLVLSCTVQESDLVTEGYKINKPLAYVKRPVDAVILADPRTNAVLAPGGNLFLHDLDDPTAPDINVTGRLTAPIQGVKGAGDVMSINTSYDGKRIVFAMHEGLLDNVQPPNQNTWDIWELLLSPEPGEPALRRVISSVLIAREGNDLDPVYLPDGRIAFTSDRQDGGRALQLIYGLANEPSEDEEHRESALNLHVMNSIGREIKQISFNQSDDRFPTVLHTGEIVFSRWERAGITESRFDLFSVHPDGTEMKLLYGSHSHVSVVNSQDVFDPVFYKAREMADGRLVAMLMQYSNFDPNDPNLLDTTAGGGELVAIDYENYADATQLRAGKTSAQALGQVSLTRGEAYTRLGLPLHGRFSNPFPIWEPGGSASRLLISLAICKVVTVDANGDPDPNGQIYPCDGNETLPLANPEYGLFYLDTSNNTKVPLLLPEPGMALTDAVIMVDRNELLDTPVNAVPVALPNKTVGAQLPALDQDLMDREMGAIKIRSVYDTDSLAAIGLVTSQFVGQETLPCMDTSAANARVPCDDTNPDVVVDLAALADPAQTTADQRPARFVRVVGAMPSLDRTQGFAFGVTGSEMRAILGYAQVEPDGSVFVEVPANMPFALELLGKDGHKFIGRMQRRNSTNPNSRRTIRSHDHWLQVMPGETLVCNGCHEGHSEAPALNAGAGTTLGLPFTNTLPDMIPNPGETMAETRIRYSCTLGNLSCSARLLSRDLVYSDVWTDPAVRLADADHALEYNDSSVAGQGQGLSDNAPIFDTAATAGCKITDYTNPNSQGTWTAKCRIVIDYEKHIQPLWDKTRLVDDGLGGTIDRRCTICHNTADTLGGPQLPAGEGQLDLTTNGPRDTQNNNANRITSYEELLRTGFEQEIVGGVVVRAQDSQQVPVDANMDGIQDVDANGNPIFQTVLTDRVLPTNPVVSPFYARGSFLIEMMMGTELRNSRNLPPVTVDHTVMMTRGEIRLLSEWIELGVQYYNDPGSAPRN